MSRWAAVFVAASLLGGCAKEHTLAVDFATIPVARFDAGVIDGFSCISSVTHQPLAEPLFTGAGCLRLDYLAVPGIGAPGCRLDTLIKTCSGGGCEQIPGMIEWVPLPASGSAGAPGPGALEARIQAALAAPRSAPDGVVMARLTIFAKSCPEERAQPLTEPVGCVITCPAILDDVEGALTFGLGNLDSQCECAMRACASQFGSDRTGCAL